VKAARELLLKGELRRINRAWAATEPAVEAIRQIVHEAARTKTRHLILVTGVPGAGKTLVGLQTVHAHYLDDLAVDSGNEFFAGELSNFVSGQMLMIAGGAMA
jgi:putative protein kinase ArgK-like GTPase of G3E family